MFKVFKRKGWEGKKGLRESGREESKGDVGVGGGRHLQLIVLNKNEAVVNYMHSERSALC